MSEAGEVVRDLAPQLGGPGYPRGAVQVPAPLIVRYCATGAAKSRNMATTSPEIDVQFARVMCRLACTALAALPEPLMTGASNDAHSPLSIPLRIGEPAGPEIVPFRVPLSLE